MGATPREILDRFFPAMFAKDRDVLAELIDEDVTWHLPPFAKAKPRRGRDAVIAFLFAAPDHFYRPGSLALEPELVVVEDDRAMLLGWMTGTTKAGGPYANRYAFAMRFREGRIVEAWELLDSKLLFEQIA